MFQNMSRWQSGLVILTVVLGLATLWASFSISARQQALIEGSQYDSVFEATQAATELLRFETQVSRYAASPSAGAKDEARTRFEIVVGRIASLGQGDLGRAIRSRADAVDTLDKLRLGMASVRPLVDAIEVPGNAQHILDQMAHLETPVVTLAAIANGTAGTNLGRLRNALVAVYRSGTYLTVGRTLSGLLLVIMLIRTNFKVHRLAHRDHLTKLPNRLAFTSSLATLMARRRPGGGLTLMLLDVDTFKGINDVFGHAAGDVFLKTLAARLEKLLGQALLVARLGGDEFAILMSLDSPAVDAVRIAARICAVAAQPVEHEGTAFSSTVSIGIAELDADGAGADALLRKADLALYSAKSAGRGTYRVFDPAMESGFLERREMETDLGHALTEGQLELHFQPIVDLATHRIVTCEALVRWRHPRLGLISPTRFIPLAEETGQIKALGAWVIGQACAIARSWPAEIRVAINLSAHQFVGTELVDTVRDALTATSLSGQRLELEITESVLLRDDDEVLAKLNALRGLGATIALDDFGTGYSSLAYLHRFPIDKIKIDQSFVRDITLKPKSALIVEAIGTLAARLGILTTAEGIETDVHAHAIGNMGYAEGQGYFFDRPLSADVCAERLRAQAMRSAQAAA